MNNIALANIPWQAHSGVAKQQKVGEYTNI